MLFWSESSIYATEKTQSDYVSKRKMYELNPEYRNTNQILVIKALSSVLEYAGRWILVVRLSDNNEIPFYKSSGINSGLPDTWHPFFGIKIKQNNGAWLHKNYTFDEESNTHITSNPLYHCGCYVLAQTANDLDRLLIKKPCTTINTSAINCWIGGQVLEDDGTMPQDMSQYENRPLIQPFPMSSDVFQKSYYVDTMCTLKKNIFGSFKDKPLKNLIECAEYLKDRVDISNESFNKEIEKTSQFLHDLKILRERMKIINDSKDSDNSEEFNIYKKDCESFFKLIQEASVFYDYFSHSNNSLNKLKAYLALQMAKRFGFNYVYKMLNDLASNRSPFNQVEIVSSRAIWTMIKHNKIFADHKKSDQIKDQLLLIKEKKPEIFYILCTEHPTKIKNFLYGYSTDTESSGTENEQNTENERLLKKIRKKVKKFYDSDKGYDFDKEIYNIDRVIKYEYHTRTFGYIVAHYSNKDHFFGEKIPGLINPEKIAGIIENLKKLDLENLKNYNNALNELLSLKKIVQSSNLESKENSRGELSLQQMTTVLYMNALANIPIFKPM